MEAWARAAADVLAELGVDPERGLSAEEARARLARHGPNALAEARAKSAFTILVAQTRGVIMALLAAAAAVSLVFGEIVDSLAIVAVLVINVAIGFFSELRATRSMEALRRLGSARARVRRGAGEHHVDAAALVPGDIVLLEGGDVVSADLRLLEASRLQADESTLTGESAPVDKGIEPLPAATPLVERTNQLFRGTSVVRGSGRGVVVATGMGTELGRIARMVEEAEEEVTPLEKRLEQLGRKLVYATIAIAVVTTVVGILVGRGALLMVQMGIALAVAAIPEGLPIVATIALARGMWRLARRNALVNRLSAVEALGATNAILADKTGTLTENRMTLARVALPDGDVDLPAPPEPPLLAALEVAVLCNNAALPSSGDPLELALLHGGAKLGLDRRELLARLPEVREEAFDASLRLMATVHRDGDAFLYAVKGAPEAVVRACGAPDAWLERSERMAREGMRLLAVARKRGGSGDLPAYEGLEMLGLLALFDPPREDARAAVEACRRAGIAVVMVTGDHAATAASIARSVGLVDDAGERVVHGRDLAGLSPREALEARIFARVAPEQKLDLVRARQEAGFVVAMTGDGVNDAPALKKADIGIAMGLRGTDVAREAADVVLKDDSFASIVAAIRQGRIIFGNVRKFVLYLLSCNAGEVLLVAGATVAGASLPILPLQILFLNLVTDVFPALALAFGEGERAVMERPPRDAKEPVLTARHWWGIAAYGGVMTACSLGAYACAYEGLGYGWPRAVTVAFLTLAFAQVLHVFNVRDRGTTLFRNEIVRSPWVWGAVALCTGLLLAAVYVPALSGVLRLPPPDGSGWLVILLAAGLTWVAGQLWCSLGRREDARA